MIRYNLLFSFGVLAGCLMPLSDGSSLTVSEPSPSTCPEPWLTLFADADEDGFGDPTTTTLACGLQPGWTLNDGDCDDTDPSVRPGVPDPCDGRDNDCDASTLEAGVWFEDPTGRFDDRTATFAAGTASDPIVVRISEPGTLHICDGIWFSGLSLEADVHVIGEARVAPRLEGGNAVGGIVVDGPHAVRVSNLSLDGFEQPIESGTSFGSALQCLNGASVEAHEVTFWTANRAAAGGALSVRSGCTLTLVDSLVTEARAIIGGLMYVSGATVIARGTTFQNGLASSGGAVVLQAPSTSEPTTFTCEDCTIQRNLSDGPTGGGAMVLTGSPVTLTLVGGRVLNSTSVAPGGGIWLSGDANTVADIQGTDFDGNVLDDVHISNLGSYFFAPIFDNEVVTTRCNGLDGCDVGSN